MVAALSEMLQKTDFLIDKKEVLLEAFNENSFVLDVIYHLPDPLPKGLALTVTKHSMNMKIYETLDQYFPNGVQKYEMVEKE